MGTVASHAFYVQIDGSESTSRNDARLIDEPSLIALIQKYSSRIPVGYFLGVALKESGKVGEGYVTNEHDVDEQDSGPDYESWGIFQMGRTEAARAHVIPSAEEMIDPENNVKVAAYIFESNLDAILDAAGLTEPTADVWPYLAWAHNAGVGQPVKSIKKYRLDWAATKARPDNQEGGASGEYMAGQLFPYVDAVLAAIDNHPELGSGTVVADIATENGWILISVGLGALWLLTKWVA